MFTWVVKCWHQKHDFIHVVEATDSFKWRPNGQVCVPSPMIKKLNMRTEHYGSLVLNLRPCSGDLLVPCIASLPSVKAGLQWQCFGSSADKVLLISWFTRWRTYNTSSFHLTKIWCKMRWFAKRNFFGHGGWNLFKFSATKKTCFFITHLIIIGLKIFAHQMMVQPLHPTDLSHLVKNFHCLTKPWI